jgi:hypothetical protein
MQSKSSSRNKPVRRVIARANKATIRNAYGVPAMFADQEQAVMKRLSSFSGAAGTHSTHDNNTPRIGRVLIAQGRDAADVPIVKTFGPNTLVSFKVWTDELV